MSTGKVTFPVYIEGFPTRMVYIHYMSCLRYTILVGNPRIIVHAVGPGLLDEQKTYKTRSREDGRNGQQHDVLVAWGCLYPFATNPQRTGGQKWHRRTKNKRSFSQHKSMFSFCCFVFVLYCSVFMLFFFIFVLFFWCVCGGGGEEGVLLSLILAYTNVKYVRNTLKKMVKMFVKNRLHVLETVICQS